MSKSWYSASTEAEVERLDAVWIDAPTETVEIAAMLLEIAALQVWKFAPESFNADGDDPLPLPTLAPVRLVYAQLQQAINLWNAGRTNSNGDVGAEGFSFTPRPLDKTIRSIIRPTTGAAHVF